MSFQSYYKKRLGKASQLINIFSFKVNFELLTERHRERERHTLMVYILLSHVESFNFSFPHWQTKKVIVKWKVHNTLCEKTKGWKQKFSIAFEIFPPWNLSTCVNHDIKTMKILHINPRKCRTLLKLLHFISRVYVFENILRWLKSTHDFWEHNKISWEFTQHSRNAVML